MRRILLCLFLGLILAPASPQSPPETADFILAPVPDKAEVKGDFLVVLTGTVANSFPATFPWWSLCLHDEQGFIHRELLPDPDPVSFLEKCLARYDREVQSYSVTLRKQERIKGKLRAPEKIDVFFREQPFSVYFHWQTGHDRRADKALYVKGENNDKLVAVPHGVLGTLASFSGRRSVERDVDGEEARSSGRYTLNEFGFRYATQRVLDSWKKGQVKKTLKVEYLGVFRVPAAGDRLCYKMRRTTYDHPEEDGVAELIIYMDRDNWLQVGSVLRDAQGHLIAEYFFSNLHLNVPLRDSQFERGVMK